jgi:O-antigen/teichoic acid export membrane protein
MSSIQGFDRLAARWHWPTQRKLIGLTLPLGLVMFLVSLNTNIPRYFIEHFLSQHELGIFAAIAYLMLVGSIIQGALAQAASPRLAKYYADGRRKAFVGLLLNLLGLGAFLGVIGIGVAWGLGKPLLTLLYQSEYAQYSLLLIWLMVAALLEYLGAFLGTAITSARYFRTQVPLFASTALTLAIACYLLVPVQGLNGIPIAMIITGILRIVLCLGVLIYALSHLPVCDPPSAVDHDV